MRFFLYALTALAAVTPTAAQESRTVRGHVRDVRDSTAIAGVVVEVIGGAPRDVTDSSGAFVLRGVSPGAFWLRVRAVTFAPDSVVLPPATDTITAFMRRIVIELTPLDVLGEPVVARRRFDQIAQPSVVSLGPEEIRRAPGLLESDVIRAVQLLPGTVARNDYNIGFNVRGGESDQNLVQLDGIPVFNPSHLGGLFSTFDTDAIARTDFLTGGFPAGYSGRLSSVLDIELRPGRRDRLQGSGQVSLLSSKMLLEGPLPGGASFLASARRTYMDAVVSAFSSAVLPYYFTDLLGKVRIPTRPRGTLSFTGYWGRDQLDFRLVNGSDTRDAVNLAFGWGNRLGGIRYQERVGQSDIEARAAVSDFTTTLGLLPNLARFDNTARLLTAGVSVRPPATDRHRLEIGAGIERYTMTYDLRSPTLQTTFVSSRYRPTVVSAYVDEQWTPSRRLRLRPGIRLEHVPVAGVTGLSPRLAYKFYLTPDLALTGSAGRYRQPIHSIRDQELPITIYEFWIGASEYVPVARSDHVVFGTEGWVGSEWQVTVEGYHKSFTDLVTPNRAQDVRRGGDEFIPTRGTAWGADVLVRRHYGTVTGWLAYGYVRARRTASGASFPPAHDRRHTLNVVVNAPGPLGADLAVRWGYGSPLPYTGFIGQWDHRQYSVLDHVFEDADQEPISGPINGERYPPYSRLDLGLRWSFRALGASWEPYLQVVNAYNRQNVFLYFFDYLDAPPTRTGVSQLPFLPTFGMEIRWP